jgi:hypothetical protein
MLTGYRGILCAIVGLALVGAGQPPKDTEQAEQEQPQSELSRAADSIRSEISDLKEPVEADPPCEPGDDNRDSELCAQWKAADAANNAAEYALWTMLLGFVGTMLLVLTFWETRKTARAELRAYVAVDIIRMTLNGRTGQAEVEIRVCNQGQTPAFNSVWCGNVVISTDEKIERDLGVTPREPPKEGRGTPTTINGNQSASGSLYNHRPFTKDELLAAIAGEKSLFVFGFVIYRDAFGTRRDTIFCYRSEPLPPPKEKARGPIKREGHWNQMPFFNDAT